MNKNQREETNCLGYQAICCVALKKKTQADKTESKHGICVSGKTGFKQIN